MSVKRRVLIRYLEKHGFVLKREGAKHSIYTDGTLVVPVKRHRTIDNQTISKICKQAGLEPLS